MKIYQVLVTNGENEPSIQYECKTFSTRTLATKYLKKVKIEIQNQKDNYKKCCKCRKNIDTTLDCYSNFENNKSCINYINFLDYKIAYIVEYKVYTNDYYSKYGFKG